jgi:hypothetical protein
MCGSGFSSTVGPSLVEAGKRMKAFLIGMTIICLAAPAVLKSASAQDIDSRCGNMRDKIACTCALQNGAQIGRPVRYKKPRWWLRGRDAQQSSGATDSETITFPAKFKLKGWKLRPSPAVEGYLACMHRHGRK